MISELDRRVARAIKSVQPHVWEFDTGRNTQWNYDAAANNSEMSTRYILIDPILKALGWNLSDPLQCVVENFTNSGKPDYTLYNRRGRPRIVIEAKRICEDTRYEGHNKQLLKYAQEYQALYAAVLTNGRYWDIYFFDGQEIQREFGDRGRERPLGIGWREPTDTAGRLADHLSRHKFWRGR